MIISCPTLVHSILHPRYKNKTKISPCIWYDKCWPRATKYEGFFFFNVLCMEHPNSITPTKMVLTITYSLHEISSTHIEGFFFKSPKMYGTPRYHHSNKNGFSKLLTPYIRLAPNALSGQSIYIYIPLYDDGLSTFSPVFAIKIITFLAKAYVIVFFLL